MNIKDNNLSMIISLNSLNSVNPSEIYNTLKMIINMLNNLRTGMVLAFTLSGYIQNYIYSKEEGGVCGI